jgi:hypothetical protein
MITGYKYKSSEALSVHKVESFLYQNIELAMSCQEDIDFAQNSLNNPKKSSRNFQDEFLCTQFLF